MIVVGCRGSKKNMLKILARFGDGEIDSATEVATSLAKHNKGEFKVCLVVDGKYRILKKAKTGWKLQLPTLFHPLRYPSRGVVIH